MIVALPVIFSYLFFFFNTSFATNKDTCTCELRRLDLLQSSVGKYSFLTILFANPLKHNQNNIMAIKLVTCDQPLWSCYYVGYILVDYQTRYKKQKSLETGASLMCA